MSAFHAPFKGLSLSGVLNSSHFPLGHGELEFTWKPSCNFLIKRGQGWKTKRKLPKLLPGGKKKKKVQETSFYASCELNLKERLCEMPSESFGWKLLDDDLKPEQICSTRARYEESGADACVTAFALKPNSTAYHTRPQRVHRCRPERRKLLDRGQ